MLFKIGDISACTGLAPSAIRYYETQGLVQPERQPFSTTRYYKDRDLKILLLARQYRSWGFSLEETAKLLRDASLQDYRTALEAQSKEIALERLRLERLQAFLEERKQSMECWQKAENGEMQIVHLPDYYWIVSHGQERDMKKAKEELLRWNRTVEQVKFFRPMALIPVDQIDRDFQETYFSKALESQKQNTVSPKRGKELVYQWGAAFSAEDVEGLSSEEKESMLLIPGGDYIVTAYQDVTDQTFTSDLFWNSVEQAEERKYDKGESVRSRYAWAEIVFGIQDLLYYPV